MEDVRGALQEQIEKVKENINDVDKNISKLYGRDPNEPRVVRRVSRGNDDGAQRGAMGRLFGQARRIINNPNREPVTLGGPPPRRVSLGSGPRGGGGIRSRLGPQRPRGQSEELVELETEDMPAVHSSVVKPAVEPPKREESIAMVTDKKGIARNRRMFGALLGTLQKFQNDSKREEYKELQRQEVEKKLEQKARDEKNQLRRERGQLWAERRAKQNEIRLLEHKMKLVTQFERWEEETRKQALFIRTSKCKRPIFYLPRKMLPANEEALTSTEEYIEDLISDKKKRLEQEIERLMAPRPRPAADIEIERRSGDESEEDDGSELDEAPSPRQRHRRDTDASHTNGDHVEITIKQEVKQEPEEKVSKAADEAKVPSPSAAESRRSRSPRTSPSRRSPQTSPTKRSVSRSQSPQAPTTKKRRASRSASSSRSRSPAPKPKRRPPSAKKPKGKSTESSSSSDSSSGSSSGSGSGSSSSDSGSDSDNDEKKNKK